MHCPNLKPHIFVSALLVAFPLWKPTSFPQSGSTESRAHFAHSVAPLSLHQCCVTLICARHFFYFDILDYKIRNTIFMSETAFDECHPSSAVIGRSGPHEAEDGMHALQVTHDAQRAVVRQVLGKHRCTATGRIALHATVRSRWRKLQVGKSVVHERLLSSRCVICTK